MFVYSQTQLCRVALLGFSASHLELRTNRLPRSTQLTSSTACENPHCYSILESNGSYAGVFGQWDSNGIAMPSSEVANGGHLSNEMWILTSASPRRWVEEGIANGCTSFGGCGLYSSNGSQAYMQFWADDNGNTFFFHYLDSLTPNGGNQTYEIWNTSNGGNNNYNVYLNYNYVNVSTDQQASVGQQFEGGMELYAPFGINPNESASTFNNYYQVYVNGTGWVGLPSQFSFNSIGCGINGNTNGYCLNGISYQQSEYSDNKPT